MKKLLLSLSIVFLVLAIASGAFFCFKWDSAKKEEVEMQAIDAGEEPELPQFPWWRALENEYPLSEKGQIKEEEYQASLDAYTEELAAYNQRRLQSEQQVEADYRNALKIRDDKANTNLMLMVVSVLVFIVLAFASLLISHFSGKG